MARKRKRSSRPRPGLGATSVTVNAVAALAARDIAEARRLGCQAGVPALLSAATHVGMLITSPDPQATRHLGDLRRQIENVVGTCRYESPRRRFWQR